MLLRSFIFSTSPLNGISYTHLLDEIQSGTSVLTFIQRTRIPFYSKNFFENRPALALRKNLARASRIDQLYARRLRVGRPD